MLHSPARMVRKFVLLLGLKICGFPTGKMHENIGAPLRLWPSGVPYTPVSPHSFSSNLSKLPFKCSYQFVTPVDVAPVS